jgi:hypothetical protein
MCNRSSVSRNQESKNTHAFLISKMLRVFIVLMNILKNMCNRSSVSRNQESDTIKKGEEEEEFTHQVNRCPNLLCPQAVRWNAGIGFYILFFFFLILQESDEHVFFVGRHPGCDITRKHPSINGFHVRVHINPSLRMMSVDLSSGKIRQTLIYLLILHRLFVIEFVLLIVNGTCVSGRRIEPRVHVVLKEGDTLKMGSGAVYKLHWSQEQFLPKFKEVGGEEDTTHQVNTMPDFKTYSMFISCLCKEGMQL